MTPLLLFSLFAGAMGFSIHKKWWGATAFFIAMLVWMLVIQVTIAITLIPHFN
jgi:hypothetical protein